MPRRESFSLCRAGRFAVLLLFCSAAVGADQAGSRTAPPPEGYVLFKGEQARQALAGNLFRVAIRDVTRSDGSRATIYRDVDYPVRPVANAEEASSRAAGKNKEENKDEDRDGAN